MADAMGKKGRGGSVAGNGSWSDPSIDRETLDWKLEGGFRASSGWWYFPQKKGEEDGEKSFAPKHLLTERPVSSLTAKPRSYVGRSTKYWREGKKFVAKMSWSPLLVRLHLKFAIVAEFRSRWRWEREREKSKLCRKCNDTKGKGGKCIQRQIWEIAFSLLSVCASTFAANTYSSCWRNVNTMHLCLLVNVKGRKYGFVEDGFRKMKRGSKWVGITFIFHFDVSRCNKMSLEEGSFSDTTKKGAGTFPTPIILPLGWNSFPACNE